MCVQSISYEVCCSSAAACTCTVVVVHSVTHVTLHNIPHPPQLDRLPKLHFSTNEDVHIIHHRLGCPIPADVIQIHACMLRIDQILLCYYSAIMYYYLKRRFGEPYLRFGRQPTSAPLALLMTNRQSSEIAYSIYCIPGICPGVSYHTGVSYHVSHHRSNPLYASGILYFVCKMVVNLNLYLTIVTSYRILYDTRRQTVET